MRTFVASRIMPRTTLDIDRSVLRELKERARDERKSLGAIVSELVAAALAERRHGSRPRPFEWRTARMGPARVDLEDKEAVRKALERE
jgi:hypothetical protein